MKYFSKHIAFILLMLLSVGSVKESEEVFVQVVTEQREFVAGDEIRLAFQVGSQKKYQLLVSNSYGTTLLPSKSKGERIEFEFPEHLRNKRGWVSWVLLADKKVVEGNLEIRANNHVKKIETYLGPPSIMAGKTDYAMLVSVPVDDLDNPVSQNTPVTVNQLYLDQTRTENLTVEGLLAYDYIYSETLARKKYINVNCLGTNSKEYTLDILPALPSNFSIGVERNHSFADGNEICTFKTNVIRDVYGNIVSDGTLVNFYIKVNQGELLTSFGATINGVAQAQLLHPDKETIWSVKAFVEGMAESNSIEVAFKQTVYQFDTSFSTNRKQLQVGPILGYKNRLVPDGQKVKLEIRSNGKVIDSLIAHTQGGKVLFNLENSEINTGVYDLQIETTGVTKTIEKYNYDD